MATIAEALINVLSHCIDSQRRHFQQKTNDEWIDLLKNRVERLTHLIDQPVKPSSTRDAGHIAAQLAGLCIRIIEDKNWPLSPPNSHPHNQFDAED